MLSTSVVDDMCRLAVEEIGMDSSVYWERKSHTHQNPHIARACASGNAYNSDLTKQLCGVSVVSRTQLLSIHAPSQSQQLSCAFSRETRTIEYL
jgi:hypothetical protein